MSNMTYQDKREFLEKLELRRSGNERIFEIYFDGKHIEPQYLSDKLLAYFESLLEKREEELKMYYENDFDIGFEAGFKAAHTAMSIPYDQHQIPKMYMARDRYRQKYLKD